MLPFSVGTGFNSVLNYLFAFEVAFFESAKLDPTRISALKQFLKVSRIARPSGSSSLVRRHYLSTFPTFTQFGDRSLPSVVADHLPIF